MWSCWAVCRLRGTVIDSFPDAVPIGLEKLYEPDSGLLKVLAPLSFDGFELEGKIDEGSEELTSLFKVALYPIED
jgi:hypothetical protein